jgi:hypothetical protein
VRVLKNKRVDGMTSGHAITSRDAMTSETVTADSAEPAGVTSLEVFPLY